MRGAAILGMHALLRIFAATVPGILAFRPNPGEVLRVSHGMRLRLEAMLLRRIILILTSTTKMTPATMRTVVGSIEALSLFKCVRRRCHYGFRRILQVWVMTAEANTQLKNTLKACEHRAETQMISTSCATSVTYPSQAHLGLTPNDAAIPLSSMSHRSVLLGNLLGWRNAYPDQDLARDRFSLELGRQE